jgi:hypothetical protein
VTELVAGIVLGALYGGHEPCSITPSFGVSALKLSRIVSLGAPVSLVDQSVGLCVRTWMVLTVCAVGCDGNRTGNQKKVTCGAPYGAPGTKG